MSISDEKLREIISEIITRLLSAEVEPRLSCRHDHARRSPRPCSSGEREMSEKAKLCPFCGAYGPRQCELEDETGGVCPWEEIEDDDSAPEDEDDEE